MFQFIGDEKKGGRFGCPLFFRLINGLRCILYFVFPLLPPLWGRIFFERKNQGDKACRSFAGEGRVADYAFEVSSEGELEQVHPLIDRILQQGGSVEILFASPSVEKKCLELYEGHRERVRVLRMPLLTFFPRGLCRGQSIECWLTAPVLILCRYDFYPELFLYGTARGRRFYLVSASLKNRRCQWMGPYRCFDKIICSNEAEVRRFCEKGLDPDKLVGYELRSVRVLSRLESRRKILAPWEDFISWIEGFPKRERLILGNAWPVEMEIFRGTSLQKNVEKGKFLVLIVPHKTGTMFVKNLEEQMEGSSSSHILSHPDEWGDVLAKWKDSPGPIFFNVSGVLLEFYSLFRYALVGGGHGKGVHSLLEPFLAGCSIWCGPRVERSSEYDFLKETLPTRLHVVEDWKQLSLTHEDREKGVGEEYSGDFEKVAGWLLEDQC